MASVLVVGGAGYIGSHMVDRLIENGEDTVVVDNLCTGHRAAVSDKAKFYEGDIADKDFMRKVFKENPDIDTVIHFAAYSLVGESMHKPLKYFDNNITGLIKLLEVMKEVGVKELSLLIISCNIWYSRSHANQGNRPTKPNQPLR